MPEHPPPFTPTRNDWLVSKFSCAIRFLNSLTALLVKLTGIIAASSINAKINNLYRALKIPGFDYRKLTVLRTTPFDNGIGLLKTPNYPQHLIFACSKYFI